MNQKEWTIMIYMAGDNNLAVDMAYALEQIKGVAGEGADSPNLLVYYDGNSPSIPTLYCDFSEPKRPKYVRSFKVPEKLYDVPDKENENAADRKSVLNFVHWCVNQVEVRNENGEITNGRRAQKYAMIFSGHSLGFQDIGLFKDETSGKSMKMNDLYFLLQQLTGDEKELKKEATAAGWTGKELRRESKVLLGQKLDILGFDSCVMGMLEVGYQFRAVAKTMIASEGSVPNAGWTYAKILGCLTKGESDNGRSAHVSEKFVKDFIESQDSYTVGGVSVDMAAWDLTKLTDLAAAFDGLSVLLIDCFEDEESRIYRQMERVILQVHWKCQSYMYDQNVDLGDFCELLDRECGLVAKELGNGDDLEILKEVQDQCRIILGELKKAVILSGFSGGGYQYSNGISVFFPWSREGYEVSRKNYESLFFAKEAGSRHFYWNGFLKKYLNEVALRRFEEPAEDVVHGSKYRYFSGISFDEQFDAPLEAAEDPLSRIPGQQASKIPGQQASKIPGQQASKIPGQQASKIPGQQASKIPGQQASKIPGQQASKIPGQQASKIPGQQASKIPGQQASKIPGQQASKLAGGGSNAFFDNLRLFKNIEGRWNISGFSKKPGESTPDSTELNG